MKNRLFTFIFFIFIFSKVISASASLESILMIDVVEAVNLHCKLNNEFHCNPYVVVNFENSSPAMSQSTHKVECTKNPKWESSFRFMPKQCFGKINILIYQFLTPNDISFIGENHLYDEQDYYHGETKVGYLGRVILDLEKLPFGNIDDWFLVETLINKERIQFPSCIHLRLKWTSSVCSEHRSSIYQIIKDDTKIDKQFKPRNYIGMCKKDFAMIYKTRFSRLDTVHPLKNINELDDHKSKKCIRDPYQDFGFNHNSNLTSIEESIAFKIIKRNTGENLNFDQLVNSSTRDNTYVKSYMEFFKNKCFKKEGLDIERINNLLTNEAKNFPENTNNPFVSRNLPLTYNEKMNDIRLKNVYNDTLGQFFILEDIKNLEKMDDNTYFQTLNKFSSKIKEINYEKKIDQTIFEHRNKVKLNGKGMVAKEEYPFFRIYALYKFDGGQLPYDQLKKEFIIRPKLFNKYLSSFVVPTNIIYNFLEDECPFNSVCLDQNGIVMNSKGEDPKLLLMKETNYINDFKDFHFKETIHKKRKNNENTSTVKQIDIVINKNNLEMMKKKEILINKIFDIHPLLGEILGICNIIALNTMKDDIFIKNEENILNKYILMWDSNSRFSRNASSVLLYLITKEDNLLRTDLNFLMEGLTFGDNRSIRVFKEIAITIIIESIINAKLNNYIDLNARAILLRIFNKPFEFKVILKVNFLSIMKISDDFKEKLTFLIMKYESNPTVSFMMENSINSKQTIKSKEISIKNNSNNTINQRFQQYLNHFQEEFIRKVFNQTVNKTNAIKKGKVFMFRQSDDDSLIDKINSIKDEIKSLVIRDKFNSTYPVFPDLQEYDTYQKGVDNRTIYTKLKKHMNNMIKLNQIFNNSINQRKISLLDKFPRFKSLSNKAKLKSESLNSFAKLSFSLLKKELRVPSQKDIFEQMMSNPDTRKMIETALKNKNKVVYSNEHHGSYEIIHRKTTTKTVDKFKKTKEKIKNDVLDEKSFDEFLNQDENSVVNDPTGLFNVLKSIKQRVCSPCFLCIEIGTIYGDWDSLRPKDVEITTKEYEDVNLILKPIIIVNNIESPNKPNDTGITGSNFTIDGERVKIIEDEDCGDFDILKSANMLQIKEKIKPKIQRKFYRHVQIGNENLSKDIFKQGLNIILLERNKAYSKIFEKTFDTNNKACESEELARVIRENSCDKIIILTGIGKWMGSMTPDLIREIKNIGGPDLKNLFSADFQDNQMADHAFLLVGRRGLCMSNGVYRIKNYDIPKSLKPLTPNLSSDPNDCFFEDVSLENMNNRKTEGKFYHVIDFKFKLNLNVDNRFAYNSPAITKVSPFKAHVRGGDLITILGYNFGDNEDNVSEIYIKNVRCTNTKVINKNKITCNSGINIFDRGIGNVIVKLKNGFSSPSKTCDLFEYYGEIPKIINIQDQKKKCVYTSPKIVDSINNLK